VVAGHLSIDRTIAGVSEFDAVFGALSDPTRRELLEQLITAGPATATALAADRTITRQAVLKHLCVLEAAELVTRQTAGRDVQFVARTAPMAAAITWMLDTSAAWDRRAQRLGKLSRR
jgi:DNA-binding transcriptional ArsR family regulator